MLFGNGAVQNYTYDPVSRLASLTNDLSGTTNDLSATFSYNPASQITSTTRTGDTYAFTGHVNEKTPYYTDGRNALTQVGFVDTLPDNRGNITRDPASGKTFTFWPSTNQLWTVSSPFTSMSYDALDRLTVIDSSSDTKFAYDGLDALAEYDASDVLQRRFVFGPGMDEPIVQYEGAGTTDRRFLSSDERGSIISLTDSAGALIALNRYDEYGKPQSGNVGRFQYTGQMWLPEAGVYNYKARAYVPQLGRFLQTDPIGYEDSPNLYNYVLGDPVNLIDPFGLQDCGNDKDEKNKSSGADTGSGGGSSGSCPNDDDEIVVTGTRLIGYVLALRAYVGEQPGYIGRVIAKSLGLIDKTLPPTLPSLALTVEEQLAIEEATKSQDVQRIMEGQINDPSRPESIWGKILVLTSRNGWKHRSSFLGESSDWPQRRFQNKEALDE